MKQRCSPATAEPRGAVDLDLQQIVALDPVGPGRGDLRQDAAFELESREGVVLDIDIVGPAGLVDAARAAPSCGGTRRR